MAATFSRSRASAAGTGATSRISPRASIRSAPRPRVFDAIRGALDRIQHYPEREPAVLRRALAQLWSVDESQILLGNGATELLHWLARVSPQPVVTLATPVFSEFYRAYRHARCVSADDPDRWPREGLLVLTQPNNPTGATLPPDALEHGCCSTTNPVLIDESFLEFTGLPSAARAAGAPAAAVDSAFAHEVLRASRPAHRRAARVRRTTWPLAAAA